MSEWAVDAEALYQTLLTQMRRALSETVGPVHLVGIPSGGAWLAQRLQRDLGLSGALGTVSAAMHRDDFAKRGLSAKVSQTQLPFEVNGAHIWLIDDVLYTGRTLRAVINELFDYGRPASIKLAVLVDRGGHELPMAADCAAATLTVPARQMLQLALNDNGTFTFVIEPQAAGA